ncbi:hypothetical protein FACS189428_4150 [Clostridia bacterium]|nr:hypothetical protein FACS189428_4150 [Clostridia bacterium]
MGQQESDDIIADFYVKCRNALPKFDLEQNFSGYIRSIFKNNLKDFWKKRETLTFPIGEGTEHDESFMDQIEDPTNITEILERHFGILHKNLR